MNIFKKIILYIMKIFRKAIYREANINYDPTWLPNGEYCITQEVAPEVFTPKWVGNSEYCVTEEAIVNFDLTSSKWAFEGVTDQNSFINWLETRERNSLSNVVVTDFLFNGDNITCNMTANGTVYNLTDLELVNANKVGDIVGLTSLYFFKNKIVNYNPDKPLPNSLLILDLDSNLLTSFNPSLSLPTSLQELYLGENGINTVGYTNSETWATSQPSFTSSCNIYFNNNINSIVGTNLQTILLTKNVIINS